MLHPEKTYPLLLTGLPKEPFMPLKTKDTVDLVGPSPPLEDYKDSDKSPPEN